MCDAAGLPVEYTRSSRLTSVPVGQSVTQDCDSGLSPVTGLPYVTATCREGQESPVWSPNPTPDMCQGNL